MKICVIGAGWFGCHIATKLIDEGHSVKIFEKNKKIFSNASGNNQNRLHQGFHYPRSRKTINLSRKGFILFKKEYPFFTKKVKNNIYAISNSKKIKLNFKKYCKNLKKNKLKFKILKNKNSLTKNFKNLEGSIKCDEEIILISRAIKFFEKKLKAFLFLNYEIKKIYKLNKGFKINNEIFELVIDCTGCSIDFVKKENFTYEYCAVFLYKKKFNSTKNIALTIMDGPFYTLFPWSDKNEFGLYSVKHSRIKKSKNLKILNKNIKKTSKVFFNENRIKIEQNFKKYYPNFKKEFIFKKNLLSKRTIIENKFDHRICNVKNNNGIISIFPGKIDHIFYAYKELKKCLKKF